MTNRIAIAAKRHAGKTTLAKALIAHGFSRLGFADEVKNIHVENINRLRALLGLPADFTREQLELEKEIHRVDLQRIGEDHGRRFDPECWIKLLREKLTWITLWGSGEKTSIVIDDLRYVNEANMLHDEGFLIVKVTRDEQERIASIRRSLWVQRVRDLGFSPEEPVILHMTKADEIELWIREELEKTLNHESEEQVDLIEADMTICNTSLAALKQAAKRFIEPEPLTDFERDWLDFQDRASKREFTPIWDLADG